MRKCKNNQLDNLKQFSIAHHRKACLNPPLRFFDHPKGHLLIIYYNIAPASCSSWHSCLRKSDTFVLLGGQATSAVSRRALLCFLAEEHHSYFLQQLKAVHLSYSATKIFAFTPEYLFFIQEICIVTTNF